MDKPRARVTRTGGGAAARYRETLVKARGEGVLATFAGPSRAIWAAREIRRAVGALGFDFDMIRSRGLKGVPGGCPLHRVTA